MKNWIAIAGLLLSSSITKAQISLDPEIGLNFHSLKLTSNTTTAEYNSITGIRAGLGLQFNVVKGFYVKPGVYFAQKGSSNSLLGVTNSLLYNYVEIPVTFGYAVSINDGKAGRIFGELSPYLGFAISGKNRLENVPILGTIENDIKFGSSSTETNGFDYGLNIGFGYITPWNVYLRTHYAIGLGDLNNDDYNTLVHRGWNVSLGYKIML